MNQDLVATVEEDMVHQLLTLILPHSYQMVEVDIMDALKQ